jgi:hypothetical protein
LFIKYLCYSSYLCVYGIHFVNQFIPLLNLDQWYQSDLLFVYFSSCMSSKRSGYKKLGLDPIEPLPDRPCRARQQPMGDEKKYDGVGYPIVTHYFGHLSGQLTTCVHIP